MTRCALITGFAGMVGSHLADHLLEHTDWDLVGLVRWQEDMQNVSHLFDRINRSDRVRIRYGDLNDASSLRAVVEEFEPDYVFHLAAQSYPKTSFSSPIETLQTNVIGTANLLEALRADYWCDPDYKRPAVIHVCSSSEVFGRVPKDQLPIAEGAPFHPASPYAISKVGTDLLGRFYAEAYGMHVVTTRMFTHTGPRRGDVFAESSFAKQIAMIEAGLIEPVVRVGNLDSLRTYADVRDAVRAYHLLVTVRPTPGECYNIGGTHTCTVGSMLNTLLELSHMRPAISVVRDPERLRPIDADLQVPDASKFMRHTGWKPEIPFEQTMLDLLNHWRARVARQGAFLTR